MELRKLRTSPPPRFSRVGLAVLLSATTFGQQQVQPLQAVRVSGRIVDPAGSPIAGARLNLSNVTTNKENRTITTNQDGAFNFSIANRTGYTLNVEWPEVRYADLTFHTADLRDLDLGQVVVSWSHPEKPSVIVTGPVHLTSRSEDSNGSTRSTSPVTAAAIAGLYCSNGGGIYVLHSDGTPQLIEKDLQRGCGSVVISDDRGAVGALALSDFCCTSYPIALQLVIYRPGKPLRAFTGDGRAIFDWRFLRAGKQVAFYQDFLHGTQGQHYELRDIETGRLLGTWNGAITKKAPQWTQGLRHKST